MNNHFLFVMWEGGGTVAPELGVARALIERGHRVTVLADDSIRAEALSVGAAFTGRLDDYPTRSGYLITPLVAWVEAGARMDPNPAEVARVYRVPLAHLGREGSPQFISIPESDRPVIRYPILGTLVHAPTAAVLYQFMEVGVLDRPTRVAHLEQPVWAWR